MWSVQRLFFQQDCFPTGRAARMTFIWLVAIQVFLAGACHLTKWGDRYSQPKQHQVLAKFIKKHVKAVAPLTKRLNEAFWSAALGDNQALGKASQLENQIRRLYAKPIDSRLLWRLKESGQIKDKQLFRQLEVLLGYFQENMVDEKLVQKMVQQQYLVEKRFRQYTPKLGTQPVSSHDIYSLLQSELDINKRKSAWLAFMKRGQVIRDDLIQLIKLRNQVAQSLGYPDFYQFRLQLAEINPGWLEKLVDRIHTRSEALYVDAYTEITDELCKRFGIETEAIMPWHFDDPLFQRPPVFQLDLDPLYREKNLPQIAHVFFKYLGFDVGQTLARSDLFPREKKTSQAFCIDIDRMGDTRIMLSLHQTERSMSTLLHELGHAVYYNNIEPSLPWLLRTSAQPFVSEAVAHLFARQTKNPLWLVKFLGVPQQQLLPTAKEILDRERLNELVFLRYCLVVIHFERELYRDPTQNLDELWWRLKKHYQRVQAPPKRQQPDWANFLHFIIAPAQYHNYLLARILASQLLYHIQRTKQTSDVFGKHMGQYLKQRIFAKGARLPWRELVEEVTGEQLNPDYLFRELELQQADES